jgi:hypothetical protein
MTLGPSAVGETIRQQLAGHISRAKYRANGHKCPQSKPTAWRCGNNGELTMDEYIVVVQEGDDETQRWNFYCDAEDANHAEEQALDHADTINCIAVYGRIK